MSTIAIVMSAVIVTRFDQPRPSTENIESALRSLTPALLRNVLSTGFAAGTRCNQAPIADWGAWVGPRARITRVWSSFLGGDVITRVTGVYAYPSDGCPAVTLDYPAALAIAMRGALLTAVAPPGVTWATVLGAVAGPIIAGHLVFGSSTAVSVFTPAHPSIFNPALNGPLSEWENGNVAVTQTRDTAPSSVSQTSEEVPDGPNTTARQTETALQHFVRARNELLPSFEQGISLLRWGAIAVGVVAASYIGYRIVDSRTARGALRQREPDATS